jgi:ATP-dependent helicase/nuclease subunit A
LPLIENSLSKNHFNLLVGDAKQSIYRWRGGKMELIVHLYKNDVNSLIVNRVASNELASEFQIEQYASIEQYINPVSLNTNYRSTQEVIEFNNDFFQEITQIEAVNYPFLPYVYDNTFQQKLPKNIRTGGHVEIDFVEKDAENLAMLERVKCLVENAISEGYEQRDIAILSRSNKSSSATANFLKDLGYEIVSRDSLLLKNSGAIRLIISFLRVLNQPDNHLAKYEAVYIFFQQILHEIPEGVANNEISLFVNSDDVNDFYNYFESKGYNFQPLSLQRVAMYEMVEKIIGILGLFDKENENEYLFRFLDLVLEYGQRQSNHLQDFLKYWEDKKNTLSVKSSGERDAITITTIHRSKGLEYPIVIIPFANWDILPRWSNVFWGNLQQVDYKELTIESYERGSLKLNASPFNFTNKLANTIMGEQYIAEKQSHFLENLNMLYVAFTRPIEKLFILSAKTYDNRSKKFLYKGVGELLKKYLEVKNLFNDTESLPEDSFYIINKGTNIKKATLKPEIEVIEMLKIITEDRSEKLRLRRISEKIFDADLNKSKDKGNKVHAAFELIKSKNDVEKAIEQLIREGLISHFEEAEIKENIKKVISLPEIEGLFEPNLKVFTEKEILTPNGKAQRPDRVVLKDGISYIIDYKTGNKKDIHQEQIYNYGKLYQQMGYQNIKMLIVYLENLEVVEVK